MSLNQNFELVVMVGGNIFYFNKNKMDERMKIAEQRLLETKNLELNLMSKMKTKTKMQKLLKTKMGGIL